MAAAAAAAAAAAGPGGGGAARDTRVKPKLLVAVNEWAALMRVSCVTGRRIGGKRERKRERERRGGGKERDGI